MATEKDLCVNEKHVAPEDVGATVLAGASGDISTSGPEARHVLRKIDLHIMPLLCVTYLLQFLDKSCISYAALWGMEEDAHLVGNQYSWLTSIFYLGYLASEFPSNYLFQRFNITRVCGIYIVLWGGVLLCMAGARNFAGLACVRLFLGMLEAGVSPCFVLMTAMYYTRDEQPLRTMIWFSMNGLANIVGGLIGHGIGYIDGAAVPAWKFPFLIFGSATVAWGCVFLWLAPANPTVAPWLSEREKTLAVMRLVRNETGVDSKTWKWAQCREAVLDVQFWLINLLSIANCIPNGGVSAFGPLIVKAFGYTQFQSTLLNMPSGAAQIIALWTSGLIASSVPNMRHILMQGGLAVAILGAALIYALPNSQQVGRLCGYYMLVGYSVTFTMMLNLVQANVAGRTKKSMFASSVFVCYCVGNLIGPQLFFAREKPRYQSGFVSMIVCFAVQVLLVAALYVYYWTENRKRDRMAQATSSDDHDAMVLELSDRTDRENPNFRYAL